MKNRLIVSTLLLLLSGNALAGVEYDNCLKKEKALKVQEASECSGLRYMLNPSGCFATRKALKEYTPGTCKKIGIAENVDFSVQRVIPDNRASSSSCAVQKKVESNVAQQESTFEQLKDENARLKAEITRLTLENEQLRKTGH